MVSLNCSKLLAGLYPSHDWEVWKFGRIPRSELPLEDMPILEKYIKSLEDALEIRSPKDWYAVSQIQIDNFGSGSTALKKFGGLEKVFLVPF